MPDEQQEFQSGHRGFKPEDFTESCAGCEKPINTLSNHVHLTLRVEREIPYFNPEQMNGATRGSVGGAPEQLVVHDFECGIKALAKAEKSHPDGIPRIWMHVEGDAPFGEDSDEYQEASAKHNAAIKEQVLAAVEENL